jgi:phosphoglycolate phosphatase-like HAD superfamily hydrolase
VRLILFDLDGTLVNSHPIDSPCYLQALVDIFDFDLDRIDRDWSSYPHVTDAGILNSLCERELGRLPHPQEVTLYQQRFLELLRSAVRMQPLQPIGGAGTLLDRLDRSCDYALALATGAWAQTAKFKLAQAGLDLIDFPAAYSDDAQSRIEIMKCAYQRAIDRYQQSEFDRVIYIGDGVWDGIASAKLGYEFIGIGNNDRVSDLLSVGARQVFPDYHNLADIMEILDR